MAAKPQYGQGYEVQLVTPNGDSVVDDTLDVVKTSFVGGGAAVPADALTLAESANDTTAGATFAALAPTTTAPAAGANRSVITWAGRENLLIIPFGRNANNLTFKLRVTSWQLKGTCYYPKTVCECTVTLSSSLTGVAGQTPSNSDLFADTITVDKGIGIVLASPADDTGVAAVEVPIPASTLVEIQFIRNASATECNALYSTY